MFELRGYSVMRDRSRPDTKEHTESKCKKKLLVDENKSGVQKELVNSGKSNNYCISDNNAIHHQDISHVIAKARDNVNLTRNKSKRANETELIRNLKEQITCLEEQVECLKKQQTIHNKLLETELLPRLTPTKHTPNVKYSASKHINDDRKELSPIDKEDRTNLHKELFKNNAASNATQANISASTPETNMQTAKSEITTSPSPHTATNSFDKCNAVMTQLRCDALEGELAATKQSKESSLEELTNIRLKLNAMSLELILTQKERSTLHQQLRQLQSLQNTPHVGVDNRYELINATSEANSAIHSDKTDSVERKKLDLMVENVVNQCEFYKLQATRSKNDNQILQRQVETLKLKLLEESEKLIKCEVQLRSTQDEVNCLRIIEQRFNQLCSLKLNNNERNSLNINDRERITEVLHSASMHCLPYDNKGKESSSFKNAVHELREWENDLERNLRDDERVGAQMIASESPAHHLHKTDEKTSCKQELSEQKSEQQEEQCEEANTNVKSKQTQVQENKLTQHLLNDQRIGERSNMPDTASLTKESKATDNVNEAQNTVSTAVQHHITDVNQNAFSDNVANLASKRINDVAKNTPTNDHNNNTVISQHNLYCDDGRNIEINKHVTIADTTEDDDGNDDIDSVVILNEDSLQHDEHSNYSLLVKELQETEEREEQVPEKVEMTVTETKENNIHGIVNDIIDKTSLKTHSEETVITSNNNTQASLTYESIKKVHYACELEQDKVIDVDSKKDCAEMEIAKEESERNVKEQSLHEDLRTRESELDTLFTEAVPTIPSTNETLPPPLLPPPPLAIVPTCIQDLLPDKDAIHKRSAAEINATENGQPEINKTCEQHNQAADAYTTAMLEHITNETGLTDNTNMTKTEQEIKNTEQIAPQIISAIPFVVVAPPTNTVLGATSIQDQLRALENEIIAEEASLQAFLNVHKNN